MSEPQLLGPPHAGPASHFHGFYTLAKTNHLPFSFPTHPTMLPALVSLLADLHLVATILY